MAKNGQKMKKSKIRIDLWWPPSCLLTKKMQNRPKKTKNGPKMKKMVLSRQKKPKKAFSQNPIMARFWNFGRWLGAPRWREMRWVSEWYIFFVWTRLPVPCEMSAKSQHSSLQVTCHYTVYAYQGCMWKKTACSQKLHAKYVHWHQSGRNICQFFNHGSAHLLFFMIFQLS